MLKVWANHSVQHVIRRRTRAAVDNIYVYIYTYIYKEIVWGHQQILKLKGHVAKVRFVEVHQWVVREEVVDEMLLIKGDRLLSMNHPGLLHFPYCTGIGFGIRWSLIVVQKLEQVVIVIAIAAREFHDRVGRWSASQVLFFYVLHERLVPGTRIVRR